MKQNSNSSQNLASLARHTLLEEQQNVTALKTPGAKRTLVALRTDTAKEGGDGVRIQIDLEDVAQTLNPVTPV
jgi:hypothetical protein